ncbi:MAG: alanine/ornithine racemase family PLP-dependent enzyme [Anaerolineae bacterium]|nr:alanine/ornithine racemase family PLP-dependent enzyme [Anaerolineae bacterium]
MPNFSPRLEIYPQRIEENARAILELCHRHGIQVAAVTKVTCAHPAVAQALLDAGVDMLADSRIENLQALRRMGATLPLMLLRIPAPSQAAEVVRWSDISLNSSVATLRLLSQAAVFHGIRHQVILMVDLGDLREGIWPDRAVETLHEAATLPALDVIGLGCNLACYGGVIPTTEKMQQLIDLRATCRAATGLELPVLCGGNSANLPLLAAEGMPPEINLLRIGETMLLGCSVIDRSPWPGARQDTFRVVGEVVELGRKPSFPIGERGQDAFGGTPEFVDRGIRKRAICNLGRQDVVVDNLMPEDPGIIVLGGSSDHLILDVEEAQLDVALGSEIAFYPGYGALLAASTSAYVHKVVIA